MGAVGGADLHQLAARLAHHVGYAERAADLHQLAARHHHLFAGGDRRQHQQHRRRVVIDDTGVLRAGQPAQQIRYRPIAMAAPGTVQIVLQRHRLPHHRAYRVLHRLRQQGAPEVGMQHGAAEVEHRQQSRALLPGQLRPQRLRPVVAPGG